MTDYFNQANLGRWMKLSMHVLLWSFIYLFFFLRILFYFNYSVLIFLPTNNNAFFFFFFEKPNNNAYVNCLLLYLNSFPWNNQFFIRVTTTYVHLFLAIHSFPWNNQFFYSRNDNVRTYIPSYPFSIDKQSQMI